MMKTFALVLLLSASCFVSASDLGHRVNFPNLKDSAVGDTFTLDVTVGTALAGVYTRTGTGWAWNIPTGTQGVTVTETDPLSIHTTALDTDGTLAANSDAKVPSQKAVKTYVTANAGGLPVQTSHTNELLTTNGTTSAWSGANLTFDPAAGGTLTLPGTAAKLVLSDANSLIELGGAVVGSAGVTGPAFFMDGNNFFFNGRTDATTKNVFFVAPNASDVFPAGENMSAIFLEDQDTAGAFGSMTFWYDTAGHVQFGIGPPANIANAPATLTSLGIEVQAKAFTAGGTAPTVAAGSISYGGTTAASSNCGSLTGFTACIVINVAGTTRYIPYK